MIRSLEKKDIGTVAALHRKELGGFLSQLGDRFLRTFYKNSLNIPEMFTFVEIKDEHICGFVTGVTGMKGLYKKIISKDILMFGVSLLSYLITHPAKITETMQTLRYPGFEDESPELLTIVIEKSQRGRGLGKKLFSKTADEFKKRGIKKFRISVYDDLPANGFYKKIGCTKVLAFEFLGRKMNYYSFGS